MQIVVSSVETGCYIHNLLSADSSTDDLSQLTATFAATIIWKEHWPVACQAMGWKVARSDESDKL